MILRNDLPQFTLQVLTLILHLKITGFTKEICEFCIFASKEDNEENNCLGMMLTVELLQTGSTSLQWARIVMRNLLGKSGGIRKSVDGFVMVVWQRWPNVIDHELIGILSAKQNFFMKLSETNKSVYMAFFMLLSYFL
jgi:hypothetical protein